MRKSHAGTSRSLPRTLAHLGAALVLGALGGCAALTNPVADAIPVRRVPPELLGKPRDAEQSIPLTLLHQKPPDVYRLGHGDILGIWVEGVMGERRQTPPVYFPQSLAGQPALPPATGVPVPVKPNGTITLPLVKPIDVQGLSLSETEDAITKAYTVDTKILPKDRANISVSLLQPRTIRVAVLRQEAGGYTSGIGGLVASSTKRGTGFLIDLPAYENDVLTVLTRTGGLPGLDAYDDVLIERNFFKPGQEDATALLQQLQTEKTRTLQSAEVGCPGQIIRIPLRWPPDKKLPFKPEDVLLNPGDVVYLEARDIELFYTGGLLPRGEHILPRNTDLDVVQAVAQNLGLLVSGAISSSATNGVVVAPGIGQPSPSLLTVIRRLPGGGQIPILVDLNRALRDPRERILVKPQDILILQESPEEALLRYFSQQFNITFHKVNGETATTISFP